MSIWTDLLFLHGHIATPAALALVARVGECPAVAAEPVPTACRCAPEAAAATDDHRVVHHPLRVTGQIR